MKAQVLFTPYITVTVDDETMKVDKVEADWSDCLRNIVWEDGDIEERIVEEPDPDFYPPVAVACSLIGNKALQAAVLAIIGAHGPEASL